MAVVEELNSVGLKATGPRLKVLQVFHSHPSGHLSAEDVYRRLVEENHAIGLATIYRVLGQLTGVGILSRSIFDAESGKAVYELRQDEHHDHIVCLGCGRVDEFFDEVIEQRQKAIAKSNGYALAQHQLALYGYCGDCRAATKSRGARSGAAARSNQTAKSNKAERPRGESPRHGSASTSTRAARARSLAARQLG